jgi:6-phosphogluconolactonase
MSPHISTFPSRELLVDRAREIVVDRLRQALSSRPTCSIALSGGSTPAPLYAALAECDLPWSKIHIFWGDERYVPASHPDSNEGMTRRVWLDKVAIPPANIHPMPTAAEAAQTAADEYEATLYEHFNCWPGEFPVFDVILLGMGDDGHTASLFPHTPALNITDRLVTVGDKDGNTRLTFTAPLINRSRCTLFLLSGSSKQPALDRVLAPTGDSDTYPARLIQPAGELWWLLHDLQATGSVSV